MNNDDDEIKNMGQLYNEEFTQDTSKLTKKEKVTLLAVIINALYKEHEESVKKLLEYEAILKKEDPFLKHLTKVLKESSNKFSEKLDSLSIITCLAGKHVDSSEEDDSNN